MDALVTQAELNPCDIRHLLQRIYDLPSSPSAWSPLLSALCVAACAPLAYVALGPPDRLTVTTHRAATAPAARLPDLRAYQALCGLLYDKPAPDRAQWLRSLPPHHQPAARWSRVEAPTGQPLHHQAAALAWSDTSSALICLGLHDDPDAPAPAQTAARADLLAVAVTHLATAARVRARAVSAMRRRMDTAAALDALPYAVILLNDRGDVVEANPRALSLPGDCPLAPVALYAPLRARKPAEDRRFQAAVAAAWGGGADALQTCALGGKSAEVAWRLRLYVASPLLCVEVRPPVTAAGLDEAVARACALYGVTPAEGRALRLLAEGMHPSEVSQRLGLTVGSVNQYSHRIFGKLGVHSQRELVCLLRDGLTRQPWEVAPR